MSSRTSLSNPMRVRSWRPENRTAEWPRSGSCWRCGRQNQRFGSIAQLGDIATAVAPPNTGVRSKPVQHPYQSQFALYDVREDAAEQFSCVNRLDAVQASPKAAASKAFGKYYGAVFRLGKKDGPEATTLATLWTRAPKGYWMLISYDVDPEWDEYSAPNTATTVPRPAPTEYAKAPAGVIDSATKFLMAWLVKQDVDQASSYLSAGCARCLLLNRPAGQNGTGDGRRRGSRS